MRAISADTAIAVGKVLKMGKQLAVAEAEVFNEGSDKVAAKIIFTGMFVGK